MINLHFFNFERIIACVVIIVLGSLLKVKFIANRLNLLLKLRYHQNSNIIEEQIFQETYTEKPRITTFP